MRLSNPSLLIFVFLLVDAATTTTTTSTKTTTEKLCLDLTSMVEGATIEVLRLVVKEKGSAEEEYVIDLTEKKVFPKSHESANSLEVSHAESEEKFEVESMPCGGSITKHCGVIELPQTYGPGLDCTWTFNPDDPIEYTFDTFEVSLSGKYKCQLAPDLSVNMTSSLLTVSISLISRCQEREMSFLSRM